ncbi:MAG: hypothetical protein MUO19_03260 [Dehalococcoidales bacterium]|nr:hypothetical protein [Dehalococcoidales bacterium]
MPGTSRNRGKNSHHSKKSKAIQRQKAGIIIPAAVETVRAVETVTAALVEETHKPRSVKILEYPYVTSELKRIGILAGILLVILIILSIVLS